MMKAIEDSIGIGITIQELFDMVIGTSTGNPYCIWSLVNHAQYSLGGIIALGIFKRQWTVEDAMEKFIKLSREAFHPRQWLRIPTFRHTAQMLYSYRYKSSGIEGALQEAFSDTPLFGYSDLSQPDNIKVGVFTASNEDGCPYLLANYTRKMQGKTDRGNVQFD